MSRNNSSKASSDALGRRAIALPAPASVVLEELVGRNGHDDLARLVFDEGGKREHRGITQAAEQAEKNQKPKQTRHDQTRRISVSQRPAILSNLRPRPETADKTALAVGSIAGIWNRGFVAEP